MISLRSTPARVAIASPLTLLALCAALLALPATGMAAPEGSEEGSPPAPPVPQLSFEPGSYDFGLRQVNNNDQTTIQLRNTGEATAPVYSLQLNGGSGAFWLGQSDCYGRNLNPNESCYVQVNFGPWDGIPFNAQLRAESEGGSSFTAEISGEGGRARISAETESTNFGSVAVGSPGLTKTIDVTNTGNYPGGSFIAVIAGGAIGSFQLLDENCTGIPLSPGATCNLVVRFQPLSTGAKTARLGLFGDSEGGAQITLTGVGLDPEPVEEADAQANAVLAPATPRRKHRVQRARRNGGLHRPRRIALADRRLTH
jgi:hypothetical protein